MDNNTNGAPLSETLSAKETFIDVYKYTLYKNKSSLLKTFLMGFAAGCFIGIAYIGSIYVTRAWPATWPVGLKNLIFGLTFTLAITMIIFMGGELFTSNSMMILAVTKKQIKLTSMLLNLIVVLLGNFVGCFVLATLTALSGFLDNKDFLINASDIFNHKLHLPWWQSFFSGILCNFLVAGSVYISHSTRNGAAKLLLIMLVITIFAASGFSHVVANGYVWFLGPLFNFYDTKVTFGQFLQFGYQNQLPTLFGNFIGGGVGLPFMYYFMFKKELPPIIEI